ncbi:uncharacterized protein LOC115689253 isoform X2 [Syzygium oleosum]|uniref:uncharacterized protein LOC115689253 isoform X2 n=1 Tax=Syzygium oleosum TaxID=219896 RepID=UPI0024BB0453|nr:uncharacterized protein LOC115689253 isoform X2 [Syzygium oleosum]
MHPHSYALDSLSKSQDLAAALLSSSSSSPPHILSACAAVDSFLHSHATDQSRHFFSLAFPPLIAKLFGFGDDPASSPRHGWIDAAPAPAPAAAPGSGDRPDLAARVLGLFAPSGALVSSILAVDRLGLVKFVFPNERLPEWARFVLADAKDGRALGELCSLFRGRVEEDSVKGSSCQVQLNVFEYFVFWFAYYPVCRGNCENSDRVSMKKIRKFRLENWTGPIRGFSGVKRGNERNDECNLYLWLLYAYLRAFVPVSDADAHQPYRSSILHYPTEYDGSALVQAEFFVDTLIHYWLADNDFSPVSANVSKSFGVSFPFRSVLGETPPTPGLGEVVKLFVRYLNLSAVKGTEGIDNVENNGGPSWKVWRSSDAMKLRDSVNGSHFLLCGSWNWNLRIQRPLYRYVLRTFLFCPVEASIKNASQVFSVWVSYMEPWFISSSDFAELDAIVGGSAKNEKKAESLTREGRYSSRWRGYVLSNYLYYSSLVMHFVGFAHKFLHTDPEVIVQMVLKVLCILTSSKELLDLIKNVNTLFHMKEAGFGKSALNDLYGFIPSIREQLQDWEDGLCENDADGSFLHENWNKDLRLFSDGEDGGQQLLQLFILRAEAELQTLSGNNLTQNLQHIDSLKSQLSQLFGGNFFKPLSVTTEVQEQRSARDGIFKPRRVVPNAFANISWLLASDVGWGSGRVDEKAWPEGESENISVEEDCDGLRRLLFARSVEESRRDIAKSMMNTHVAYGKGERRSVKDVDR